MLVLSRRKHERIVIDGGIVVTIVDVRGDNVRIGFEAPREVGILREELTLGASPPPADSEGRPAAEHDAA